MLDNGQEQIYPVLDVLVSLTGAASWKLGPEVNPVAAFQSSGQKFCENEGGSQESKTCLSRLPRCYVLSTALGTWRGFSLHSARIVVQRQAGEVGRCSKRVAGSARAQQRGNLAMVSGVVEAARRDWPDRRCLAVPGCQVDL